MLASPDFLPCVTDFQVLTIDIYPTHQPLIVRLAIDNSNVERLTFKKPTSLADIFEQFVNSTGEGKQGKELSDHKLKGVAMSSKGGDVGELDGDVVDIWSGVRFDAYSEEDLARYHQDGGED